MSHSTIDMPLSDPEKKAILDLFDLDTNPDITRADALELTEQVMASSLSEAALKGFIQHFIENPKMHTAKTGMKAGNTRTSSEEARNRANAKRKAEEAVEAAKRAYKMATNAKAKAEKEAHLKAAQNALARMEASWKKGGAMRAVTGKRRKARKATRKAKKVFFGLF